MVYAFVPNLSSKYRKLLTLLNSKFKEASITLLGNIDTDDLNKWRTIVTEVGKYERKPPFIHRLKNTQLSFYASTTNKDMGKEVQRVTKKGRSMANWNDLERENPSK